MNTNYFDGDGLSGLSDSEVHWVVRRQLVASLVVAVVIAAASAVTILRPPPPQPGGVEVHRIAVIHQPSPVSPQMAGGASKIETP